MQRTLAATILALVVLAPAANAEARLQFSTPGDFSVTESELSNGEWLLLVFDESPATFKFQFEAAGVVENLTWVYPFRAYNRSVEFTPYGYGLTSSQEVQAGASYRLDTATGRASLYIEADRIQFQSGATAGRLAEKPDADGISDFMRTQDDRDYVHRYLKPTGDHAVVQYLPTTPIPFQVSATGVRHLEWHGARVACSQTDWCPDGGTSSVTKVPMPTDMNVTSERYSYEIVREGVEAVHGEGAVAYAVAGGSALRVGLDGARLRLPLASVDGPCPECTVPADQTLTAGGDLALANLRRSGEARLEAELDGSIVEARLDEAAIDPALLGFNVGSAIAATAAVGGIIFLLKAILGWLFTRHKEEGPLDHERRRRLYDCIVEQPGLHVREVMRRAHVSYGAGRYHLVQLVRAGMVIERQHHNSVCLFPNDERFAASWKELAALRDPLYRELHDWLVANPNKAQNEIVAAFTARGWSRTQTQARLERLVQEDLLQVRQQGRYKFYSAARPPVVVASAAPRSFVGPLPA